MITMTRRAEMTSHRAGSDGVERNIQKFLGALAAGGGKPMEQMTPAEARAVLVGAQSSVTLDLPKPTSRNGRSPPMARRSSW